MTARHQDACADARPDRERIPFDRPHRSTWVPGVQVCARAAASAGLSVAVAQYFGLPFPIYSMIAAVIVTDLSAKQTRRLGVPRLAGTVVGAVVGVVLSQLLPSNAGAIALGIAIAMLLSYLARFPETAKLSGYVCGIILLGHGDQPLAYALGRFLETLLGIGMAIAVGFVPKLIRDDALEGKGGGGRGHPVPAK
jgi:uncharacterized membrane protein YgaE (UPF0421/DUF939 family)